MVELVDYIRIPFVYSGAQTGQSQSTPKRFLHAIVNKQPHSQPFPSVRGRVPEGREGVIFG